MRPSVLALAIMAAAASTSPVFAAPGSATSSRADSPAAPSEARFQISLPVVADGIEVGAVLTDIAGTTLVAFDKLQWRAVASEQMEPQLVAQILAEHPSQSIEVSALQAKGIDVQFDMKKLQVTMALQDTQRRARSLSVREPSLDYQDLIGVDLPGRSAYLNLSVAPEYRWDVNRQLQSRSATQASLDGALSLFSSPHIVLEGAARYDSDTVGDEWQRGNFRLLHDDIGNAVRYSLGDIFYRATDFQTAPPLLGLSIERAFEEIQPLRNITPTGSRTVVVNQRSTVDVYVNGLYQKTVQVDPGRYQLSDFAFNAGVNEVELVITDTSGEQQRINFSLFSDPSLLTEGLSEFSFNLGYAQQNTGDSGLQYDTDLPILSSFYRRGISEKLTLGASLQGSEEGRVYGAEGTLATPAGIFSANLAASSADAFGDGHAASLRWSFDYFPGQDQSQAHELDLVAIARSKYFYSLSLGEPAQQYRREWRARYSAPAPFGTYVAGSLRYAQAFAQGEEPERAAGIDVSRRFGALSTTVRLERETGMENDTRLLLRVSMPIGRRSLTSGSWNAFDNTGEVAWSRFARDQVHDWSGGVVMGAEENDIFRADAQLEYQANRFVAGVDHSVTQFSSGGTETAHVTRARFASSLVYSDGTFAMGRPVDDAFVLVKRHPTLSDTRIMVGDLRGEHTAIADDWGPAVVPRVESYVARKVQWQAESAPFGYDIGDIEATPFPFYRSGVSYTVGSDASITAIGVALDRSGTPVPMAVGYIHARDDREFAPVSTFTNRQGRFVAQALAPGDYVLKFPGLGNLEIPFTIEQSAVGITELGAIREQTRL